MFKRDTFTAVGDNRPRTVMPRNHAHAQLLTKVKQQETNPRNAARYSQTARVILDRQLMLHKCV